MKLTVLGAGAWGTAMAASAARRHDVVLWSRDEAQAHDMRAQGRNGRYLPEVPLPSELHVTADWDHALRHARDGLLVVATPMAGLRHTLSAIRGHGSAAHIWWLCKGFEQGTGLLGHEVARDVLGEGHPVGVLSGPSFALEVALGQPTALVAASRDEAFSRLAQEAFHGDLMRVYRSSDPVGVEVGGAVKNVMAIATGIADGLQWPGAASQGLGLNARAALVTRGLAEMSRLGMALGAQAETFMGLSGLGDLVLTATGNLSRNRKVGLLLAQGLQLDQILAQLGHVSEGVYSAATVLARAQVAGVEMPIAEAVVQVIEGRCTPMEAMLNLMRREARQELGVLPGA
ncbi:MAG: NAD(P)-dependent glycerol-3-phosphate dehydrogenase [Burkholderiaceae bacterium]|nr:MAG: NAD(P)-dependent glycerol-3-phosphate dehydrogenase [Burkholderiaceae bacterium]